MKFFVRGRKPEWPPYYACFSGADFIQVSSKKLKIRVNQFTNSPVETFDIFCS